MLKLKVNDLSIRDTFMLSDYTKLLVEGMGETQGNHLRLNLLKMTFDAFCIQAVTPTYFFICHLSVYLSSI